MEANTFKGMVTHTHTHTHTKGISKLQNKNKDQSPNSSIVSLALLNTDLGINKHKQDSSNMSLVEILRLMYREMESREYMVVT